MIALAAFLCGAVLVTVISFAGGWFLRGFRDLATEVSREMEQDVPPPPDTDAVCVLMTWLAGQLYARHVILYGESWEAYEKLRHYGDEPRPAGN